jgi:hypothetical protein
MRESERRRSCASSSSSSSASSSTTSSSSFSFWGVGWCGFLGVSASSAARAWDSRTSRGDARERWRERRVERGSGWDGLRDRALERWAAQSVGASWTSLDVVYNIYIVVSG